MTARRGRTHVGVAFVIVLLVVTVSAQDGRAAAKKVTAAEWADATCTAAEKAVAAIEKSVRRGNRALTVAESPSDQRDALSDVFTRIAAAYDRLLAKMVATGEPTGKNAQKVAATVQEGFIRARDVYRRSSFNVNSAPGNPAAGELTPPELEEVNSRELRSALKKYPAPDLAAAFSNTSGCANLYFSQILLEATPPTPG